MKSKLHLQIYTQDYRCSADTCKELKGFTLFCSVRQVAVREGVLLLASAVFVGVRRQILNEKLLKGKANNTGSDIQVAV